MMSHWPLAITGALVSAATAQQPGAGFPAVGVAATQTARINVLNEAPTNSGGPPQDSDVIAACQVVMQFFGSDGQLLKEKVVDNLAPGKIAFLDLTPADRPGKDLRTPIRGVARFGYSGGANPMPGMLDACRAVLSLEIFDVDSGKTQILLTETRPLAIAPRSIP